MPHRRVLTTVMQLRLAPEDHARLTERAAQRGTNISQAARELLELGLALADAERSGLLLTDHAMRLLTDSVGRARLGMAHHLDDEAIEWLRAHGNERITDEDAERLRTGMVLLATAEELDALDALGSA